ncbi:MAG: DMT family transporter [Pseudomonadota bacterium]
MAPRLSSHPYQNQVVKAIGLMVLATLCLAALDATAKYLTDAHSVPVAQVVWLRFLCHVLFSAIFLWPFAFRPSLKSAKPGLQFVRSCLMILTTALNFVALKYLQLDQNIAIFFLMPLLVAALSGPLLGEWVGWHRALAIFAGFIGVLVVMHPGVGEVHWAMLFTLGATLGYSLFTIATRYLAAFDPPAVTQTYTPLVGVLIMTPFGLMEWNTPDQWWVWLLFASLGFWGGLGHWIIILAHRLAPANVLAPYIYLGIIWMSAFGFLLFEDVPTWWTIAGAAIVILAGLYLLARERIAEERNRSKQRAAAGSEFDPPQ